MTPAHDHPQRYALVNELHARPFPALGVPCDAVFVAIKEPLAAAARDRATDHRHLSALLERHGAPPADPAAIHYSGRIGKHDLKWESHTEFVTYQAVAEGKGGPAFDPEGAAIFPEDWLAAAPGKRIAAIAIRVEYMNGDRTAITDRLEEWFVAESLACAEVLDGAAVIAGDFRIDLAGQMRFALFVRPGTGARRVGRIVQRLCEIETYRAVSMLGLERARELNARLNDLEPRLESLVAAISAELGEAGQRLDELLSLSAELERLAARVSFRFGATGAYEAIVNERIVVLREARFEGRQTFAEFMKRRYDPAMRTVRSAERRLAEMATRAERAGDLMRTRVDVERSGQNQKLLESMDRRADMQLRLQRTVEGLSVVAISYYAVSLATYLLAPAAEALEIGKATVTAALVLPVLGGVWLLIARLRRKLRR